MLLKNVHQSESLGQVSTGRRGLRQAASVHKQNQDPRKREIDQFDQGLGPSHGSLALVPRSQNDKRRTAPHSGLLRAHALQICPDDEARVQVEEGFRRMLVPTCASVGACGQSCEAKDWYLCFLDSFCSSNYHDMYVCTYIYREKER